MRGLRGVYRVEGRAINEPELYAVIRHAVANLSSNATRAASHKNAVESPDVV